MLKNQLKEAVSRRIKRYIKIKIKNNKILINILSKSLKLNKS